MSMTNLPLSGSINRLNVMNPSAGVVASSESKTAAFSAIMADFSNSASSSNVLTGAATATTPQSLNSNSLKSSEGVLKTVYDPATGREFVSPVQAFQYGVKNYTETQPSGLPLPKSLSDYSPIKIADMAKQFNMTEAQLINKERQAEIRSADSLVIRAAIETESNGLTPSQLVDKLEGFKSSPPSTFQQFQEQHSLWADYTNRYANSSWNYANMEGKPQDHSLKPETGLRMEFTGYAAPINLMLSSMNQQSPQFQDMAKLLQKNPEISDVVNELYSINPEQSFFNSLNKKYAGGTSPSTMASNFAVSLINLSNKMDNMGKDPALRQFLSEQQNLLAVLPDESGKVGNPNLASMSNPQFRVVQKMLDQFTPKVSDAQWLNKVELTAPKEGKVSAPYRDSETGKGVALQSSKTGQTEAVRLYDAAGSVKVVPKDPAKLVEAIYTSGVPLKAFDELAKEIGSDVLITDPLGTLDSDYIPKGLETGVTLNDISSGKLVEIVASEDWLNTKIAEVTSKNTTDPTYAGGLNYQIAQLKNQSAIAKAFSIELSTKTSQEVGNVLPQIKTLPTSLYGNLETTAIDSLLNTLDAQLRYRA